LSVVDVEIRDFRPDDLDGAYDLFVEWQAELVGEPELTRGMFDNLVEIADAGFVAETAGGVVGTAFIRGQGGDVFVRGSERRRGIGTRLLRAIEGKAEEKVLSLVVMRPDDPARYFLEANGYSKAWEYWLMGVDLEEPREPIWPEGASVRTFREDDAAAVKELLDVSYAAEPHHVPLPFEDWRSFMLGDPSYDPEVWFLALAEDRIVGAALNWKEGYVKDVVVHPEWRGRGLGKALMLQTFGEFARRGIPRITLKTDSINPTQAWGFYEHLGMTKERTYEVFDKPLAG
jgi:ribosomal protein S18 acetylase RimI-like enzyme